MRSYKKGCYAYYPQVKAATPQNERNHHDHMPTLRQPLARTQTRRTPLHPLQHPMEPTTPTHADLCTTPTCHMTPRLGGRLAWALHGVFAELRHGQAWAGDVAQ